MMAKDAVRSPKFLKGRTPSPQELVKVWPTPRVCSAMAATITPKSVWKDNRFPNLETVVGQRMWPTPCAGDVISTKGEPRPSRIATNRKTEYLARMVHWPTPTESEASHGVGSHGRRASLNSAVNLWPTPTKSDYRSPNLNPAKKGQIEPASGHALPAKAGGQLNPMWVEWLMGYPSGWTDLEHSGTP